MIRYCRQRCGTRCGPVALLNLAKWRGEHVTYRDIPRFEKVCGWSRREGTPIPKMMKALGRRPRKLSFIQFKQHLQRGGIVILHTDLPDEPEAHYCLAMGIDEQGRYMLVNYCQKHMPCRWVGRRMAYLLSYSQCWTFRCPRSNHSRLGGRAIEAQH